MPAVVSPPSTFDASPCSAVHELPHSPESALRESCPLFCPRPPGRSDLPAGCERGTDCEATGREGCVLGIGDAALELNGESKGEAMRVLPPLPTLSPSSSSRPEMSRRVRGRRAEAGVELVRVVEWEALAGFMAVGALADAAMVEQHRGRRRRGSGAA